MVEKQNFYEEYKRNGYVILKNIIPKNEVDCYLNRMKEVSGLDDSDYELVINGEKEEYVDPNQAMVNDKVFWPLLVNKDLLDTLKTIFKNNEFCFFESDALIVHRSAGILHRDAFIKTDNLEAPDFDPSLDDWVMPRVAMYLTPNEFLCIPGSHKKAYPDRDPLKFSDFKEDVVSINLEPGDLIIFDSLLLHAGRYITKPKYMLVWTYSLRNMHTIISHFYTRIITLGKRKNYSKDFKALLENDNLYWNDLENDEKYLNHFDNVWKDMPKNDDKENIWSHWSPYVKRLY